MVATLNYDLKDAPAELFDKCRWSLLTMFILHANVRNRCWPSMRGLAKRLDMSLPYITQAKQWLIDHEAIKLVPYKERVDDEKELANHHHVYQLTGYVKFGDVKIQYLYISPDRGNDQPDETLKRGKGKRRETSKPGSMINSVNDQRFSPLSIPIEESTKPNQIQGTSVPSPASETPQPIEPEAKRESVEPEPPIVKERIEEPKEKSSAKKEKVSIPPPSTEFIYEMARVCYGSVDAAKVNGNRGYICKVYYDLYPAWGSASKADVIFFERRWYQHDWRGQKRERPTPANVKAEWYNLMNKEPRYVKQTTAPASAANPAETGQAVPDQTGRNVGTEGAAPNGTGASQPQFVSAAEWQRRMSQMPGNKVGEGGNGQG